MVNEPWSGGVEMKFSPDIETAITVPGRDERPNDKIVWLIWTITEDAEYSGYPTLHAICSTEYSTRYHIGALMEQNGYQRKYGGKDGEGKYPDRPQPRSEQWLLDNKLRFHVERAPCDHMFGSSVVKQAQEYQYTKPIKVGDARKFEFGGD